MFATREGVFKEETKASYPIPVIGGNISDIVGETIAYPFFPSPPPVYPIMLSSQDLIHVVRFSKIGETTQLSVFKHKFTTYFLQIEA
jgi:hypothetical protein